jgi:hypothetical protein
MAKITSITLHHKDNYIHYDDTDIMTDYFHGYSLGQKYTVEWLKKDGASLVDVKVNGNDEDIPYMRRLKQIAKGCGYKITDKTYVKTMANGQERKILEFELSR